MVNYVTKKNRAVILLSTNLKHQTVEIPSTNFQNKPDLILDYNKNKGKKINIKAKHPSYCTFNYLIRNN